MTRSGELLIVTKATKGTKAAPERVAAASLRARHPASHLLPHLDAKVLDGARKLGLPDKPEELAKIAGPVSQPSASRRHREIAG